MDINSWLRPVLDMMDETTESFFWALCVVVCLIVVWSPWIWIMFRRNTAASAWNSRPADQIRSFVSNASAAVSRVFQLHLEGRIIWAVILAAMIIIMYSFVVFQLPEQAFDLTVAFACCWVTSFAFLGFAWWRLGIPHGVQLGLIANFFLHGGICGSICAVVVNMAMLISWMGLSPNCHLQDMVFTPACNVIAAIMWILTPGLVEETFKCVWLFFRLRRAPEDAPRTCCFCLPSSRGYDCGCWYKLAPTPYHVVLCALASGAGFECFENLLYVFGKSGIFGSLFGEEVAALEEVVPSMAFSLMSSASAYTASTTTITNITTVQPPNPKSMMMITAFYRVPASVMHMVWTGFVGIGLARRLFSPESQRPSLLTVLLPSIVAHGLSNYALTAMTAAQKTQHVMSASLLLMLFMSMNFGSCFVMAQITGGCGLLCGDDSCFCADGFWEEQFGPLATARRREDSPQNTALEAPRAQTMSAMENGGVEAIAAVQPSSFEIGREALKG